MTKKKTLHHVIPSVQAREPGLLFGTAVQRAEWEKKWIPLLTVERRAAWLLDLAGVKFDELNQQDKARLVGETAAFLEIFKAGAFAREHVAGCPFPDGHDPGCPIREADLAKFQKWLKEGTDTLLQGKPWQVQASVDYRITITPEGGFWTYEIDMTDVQMVLRRAAFETLRDAKKEARHCPECGRLFIPRRSQVFCSNRCGHLTRTRRWIEKRQPALPPPASNR